MASPPAIDFDSPLLSDELLRFQEACNAGNVQGLPDIINSLRQSNPGSKRLLNQQLYNAIMHGNEELASCFCSEGVPITGIMVQRAARSGSVKALQTILNLGWDINRPCGPTQGSALS